mgnify:CR=1 FL=1
MKFRVSFQKTCIVTAFSLTNIISTVILMELLKFIMILLGAGFREGEGVLQITQVITAFLLVLIIPISWFGGVVSSAHVYWNTSNLRSLIKVFLQATGIELLCVPLIPLLRVFAVPYPMQVGEWLIIAGALIGGGILLFIGRYNPGNFLND